MQSFSLSRVCSVIAFVLIRSVSVSATGAREARTAAPQDNTPLEKLHGVVSSGRLTPPLRSAHATLTYSRDGRYLVLQDGAGIYLLTHNPLRVLGYLEAPNSYAARFSADSQS